MNVQDQIKAQATGSSKTIDQAVFNAIIEKAFIKQPAPKPMPKPALKPVVKSSEELAAELQAKEYAKAIGTGKKLYSGPKITRTKENLFPMAIEDLVGKVDYLRVQEQGIDECGYRAIYNAKAVQELIEKNEKITSEKVNKRANKLAQKCIKQEKTSAEDIEKLSKQAELQNKYVCRFQEGKPLSIFFGPNADPKGEQIIKKFHSSDQVPITTFICNTKEHWIAIIVIKLKDKTPYYIYMNSLNSPLTKESEAYKLLKALIAKIG